MSTVLPMLVLFGPHHGADNGSADCFIAAGDPTFEIFSAGAQHRHPRAVTAERYLTRGVPLANVFRTDRGDDEGGDEWDHGRVPGCRDASGTITSRCCCPSRAVRWWRGLGRKEGVEAIEVCDYH